MLVWGREGSSRDGMGIWCDNVKPRSKRELRSPFCSSCSSARTQNNTVCCSLQPNERILNWESSSKLWFAILILPYSFKVSSVRGSHFFIVRFFSFSFQPWEVEAPLESTSFWWLPLFSSLVFLIICGICKEKLEPDQPWKLKMLGESLPLKSSLCARAVWGDEMLCQWVMSSIVIWFLSVCQVKIHFPMHVRCSWWNTRRILTGYDPLIEKEMSFDDVFWRKNRTAWRLGIVSSGGCYVWFSLLAHVSINISKNSTNFAGVCLCLETKRFW